MASIETVLSLIKAQKAASHAEKLAFDVQISLAWEAIPEADRTPTALAAATRMPIGAAEQIVCEMNAAVGAGAMQRIAAAAIYAFTVDKTAADFAAFAERHGNLAREPARGARLTTQRITL